MRLLIKTSNSWFVSDGLSGRSSRFPNTNRTL